MSMEFKINEVIEKAQKKGIEVTKRTLAKVLWQDSTENTQNQNMYYLITGRTDRVKIEWVDKICKTCDCTPNELFGYEKINK